MTVSELTANGIPTTFDEAVAALHVSWHETDKEILKRLTNTTRLHHEAGRDIRNAWNLWVPDAPLVIDMTLRGFTHPDDMSSVILNRLQDELKGLAFFEEKAKLHYRKHWSRVHAAPDSDGYRHYDESQRSFRHLYWHEQLTFEDQTAFDCLQENGLSELYCWRLFRSAVLNRILGEQGTVRTETKTEIKTINEYRKDVYGLPPVGHPLWTPCQDCDGDGQIREDTPRVVAKSVCGSCRGTGQVAVPATRAHAWRRGGQNPDVCANCGEEKYSDTPDGGCNPS